MKKKYAALMMAAAIMAVPGTLAMAASPNTNVTVSHGGSSSGSASSKSAGLNVNAGTITNKTSTGIKNSGQNGSVLLFRREILQMAVRLGSHPISRSKTAIAGLLQKKCLRSMQVFRCIV